MLYLNRIGSNPVEHCIGSFKAESKTIVRQFNKKYSIFQY